jgi:hypothetical protein
MPQVGFTGNKLQFSGRYNMKMLAQIMLNKWIEIQKILNLYQSELFEFHVRTCDNTIIISCELQLKEDSIKAQEAFSIYELGELDYKEITELVNHSVYHLARECTALTIKKED